MIKACIVGGAGFTGLELLKILATHSEVTVTAVTSRSLAGKALTGEFAELKGLYDGLSFLDNDEIGGVEADIFFTALPHGASMDVVANLIKSGEKVIDLSADFRLKDAGTYKKWYGEHKAKELLSKAVYGLPELNREAIKDASLVANPGCYPTSAILALAPLLKGSELGELIDKDSIIIDSKSGYSGAGRKAAEELKGLEGFKAYNVMAHRHSPEMEAELSLIAGTDISITFTPHLLPVARGILSTVYVDLKKKMTAKELNKHFSGFYSDEEFVKVLPDGKLPDISDVKDTNYCLIGIAVDEKKSKAIIISAIDNLVKGASGQAVQNMNIIFEMDETLGLKRQPHLEKA